MTGVHPLVAGFCADLIESAAEGRADRVAGRDPMPSPAERVDAFDERCDETVLRLIEGGRS